MLISNTIIDTLTTIGRDSNTDIEIPHCNSYLSRTQCSFQVPHRNTNVVMLYDRSSFNTTHILEQESSIQRLDFPPQGTARKIFVCEEVNTKIGFGTCVDDMLEFTLIWNANRIARAIDVCEPSCPPIHKHFYRMPHELFGR